VEALMLKLTLAPALVAVATYVARHVSNRAAGLVSGLPVVAGPIVLIYAVEHGDRFAHTAAAAAILGMISLVGFCVAYALAARAGAVWPLSLVAGLAAFAAVTVLFSGIQPPLGVSIALTLAAILAGAWGIPRLETDEPHPRPASDLLFWRLAITAALVVVLTGLAGHLSSHLAGLLVPVPIITAVLACFTQAQAGANAAIALLGGLVLALVSFLAFFAVLALLLDSASATVAFGAATAAALVCWGVLTWRAT
jgi:uncharacterized membrane protein (GlpM family)